MFDVGFSEVMVCFIVALVVLGPERLPVVARAVGRWTGQARSYLRNLSAELERETQVSELKRQLQEAQNALRDHGTTIEGSFKNVESDVRTEVAKVTQTDDTPKP
jgi:sec-independent protein translocase protein TatB